MNPTAKQPPLQSIEIPSPLGILTLFAQDHFLVKLSVEPKTDSTQPCHLLTEGKKQLTSYFSGQLTHFDLPLNPQGTEFQQQAWGALLRIPYGQTWSYQQQACEVGRPKAQRAVGGANRANPLPILIPCHRVVRADHSLGGYALGIQKKSFLLTLEGADSSLS